MIMADMRMCFVNMKVVIAGCRDYDNYDEAREYIDFCLSRIKETNNIIIVSGCASGADALGERYAEDNGFQIEKHPADWQKYGRSAGPKRNKQMAEVCDFAICFWDGKSRGTRSLIEYVSMCGKPVKIKKI